MVEAAGVELSRRIENRGVLNFRGRTKRRTLESGQIVDRVLTTREARLSPRPRHQGWPLTHTTKHLARRMAKLPKVVGQNCLLCPGTRDLGLPAAKACMLDHEPEAAMVWLKTIPPQFLPASIQAERTENQIYGWQKRISFSSRGGSRPRIVHRVSDGNS